MKTFGSIWLVAVAQLFNTIPAPRGMLYLSDDSGLMLVGYNEDPPSSASFVCVVTPTSEPAWIARQLSKVAAASVAVA